MNTQFNQHIFKDILVTISIFEGDQMTQIPLHSSV